MGAPPKAPLSLGLQLLIPIVLLGTVGLVVAFVVHPGGAPSPLVIGGIVVLLFAWIGVSVLWPARADRRCPDCKGDHLQRMDPTSAEGLRCPDCGWKDPSASGWYLAEEELEALEPLAMERRRAKASAGESKIDRAPTAD